MQFTNKEIAEIITNERTDTILNKRWPIQIGFYLALNIDKLRKHYEIYNQERTKIIARYAKKKNDGTIETDENNRVIFESLDDAIACERAIDELNVVSVDIDVTPIDVKFKEFPDDITPNDILSLLKLLRLKGENSSDNPV